MPVYIYLISVLLSLEVPGVAGSSFQALVKHDSSEVEPITDSELTGSCGSSRAYTGSSSSGGCSRLGRFRGLLRVDDAVSKLTDEFAQCLQCKESLIPGRLVGLSETSRVFLVKDDATRVIKYQASYHSPKHHPLLREHQFLGFLEQFELAPRAYFAESVLWEDASELWTKNDQTPLRPDLYVHRLVMDYVGSSLRDRMSSGKLRPLVAHNLAASLLEVLQRLHVDAKVVHGDIHIANVVALADGGVFLIDFGRSEQITEDEAFQLARPGKVTPHEVFSPWELRGHLPGKRDDVFRALLVLSYMLCGVQAASLHFQTSDWSLAVFKKQSVSLFRYCRPFGEDERMYSVLDDMVATIRATPTRNAPILYEQMIATLRDLIHK